MGTLVMRRRDGTWQGVLRSYRVSVDGHPVGDVAYNAEISTPLPPGAHSVRVTIDWCGSPPFPVTIGSDETKVLECGASGSPWTAIFYVVFRAGEYLWIREPRQV